MSSYRCDTCGDGFCPGCDEPDESDFDPDLHSLQQTADGRDLTPDPPAYLDPWSILRNRRRVQIFIETGLITWPKVAA